jgi:hypothetical protein
MRRANQTDPLPIRGHTGNPVPGRLVFDQGEGSDILDAIVAEGRCGTCGTPWDRVVNVEGKRPVKIEGGCPNEVCVLGDW